MTDLGEHIAFVEQETVHVPDMSQILLVPRRLADRLTPFLNRLENAMLDPRGPDRWPFGKPPYQLIQELFGADLEMKWVSAILDTDIEQLDVPDLSFCPHTKKYPVLPERDTKRTASASNDTF